MLMLLWNPLKLYVLRNEPIKGRTWNRLPLTTESNFTLLNSMKPLNEFGLQPLCHSSLSVYVCLYFTLFLSCTLFPPSQPLCPSLHCSLLLSVRLSVSLYPSLRLLPCFVFHLHSVSLSAPTCQSPATLHSSHHGI